MMDHMNHMIQQICTKQSVTFSTANYSLFPRIKAPLSNSADEMKEAMAAAFNSHRKRPVELLLAAVGPLTEMGVSIVVCSKSSHVNPCPKSTMLSTSEHKHKNVAKYH
jgi:hypothetical protein